MQSADQMKTRRSRFYDGNNTLAQPEQGGLPSAAAKLGRAIGCSTAYARGFTWRSASSDAARSARKNPEGFLAGALAMGFLLGAVLRRM